VIVLLSPAKKLNFEPVPEFSVTTPELLKETQVLHETTRRLTAADLKRLMKLSDSLAELNHRRFQEFDAGKTRPPRSKQAALAFDGDTYVGLRAPEFTKEEMDFAQQHVAILSGLYGLLRPLDAIQPYRLEMGTRLETPRGKSLYEFWGARVAKKINQHLKKLGGKVVINCASQEYFSVIPEGTLAVPVITPVFKEARGGQARIVSFSAKRARGTMTRYIVKNRLTEASELKNFMEDGYQFIPKESTATEWLFLRERKR
jgi:uncharacterized protein